MVRFFHGIRVTNRMRRDMLREAHYLYGAFSDEEINQDGPLEEMEAVNNDDGALNIPLPVPFPAEILDRAAAFDEGEINDGIQADILDYGGDGNEYGGSGYVADDDEIVTVDTDSGITVTGVSVYVDPITEISFGGGGTEVTENPNETEIPEMSQNGDNFLERGDRFEAGIGFRGDIFGVASEMIGEAARNPNYSFNYVDMDAVHLEQVKEEGDAEHVSKKRDVADDDDDSSFCGDQGYMSGDEIDAGSEGGIDEVVAPVYTGPISFHHPEDVQDSPNSPPSE